MTGLCPRHSEQYHGWLDYKEPIKGWVQFSENLDVRTRTSVEAYDKLAEDRRNLVRGQLDGILELCRAGRNCSDEIPAYDPYAPKLEPRKPRRVVTIDLGQVSELVRLILKAGDAREWGIARPLIRRAIIEKRVVLVEGDKHNGGVSLLEVDGTEVGQASCLLAGMRCRTIVVDGVYRVEFWPPHEVEHEESLASAPVCAEWELVR